MARLMYDESAAGESTPSDDMTMVPIPGGMRLLELVEETGACLISDCQEVMDSSNTPTYEELLTIVEGHSRIGAAMVRSIDRTRKALRT